VRERRKFVSVREMVLLLLLGVLWGIPFALTKVGLESIPPVTLTALRISLAAVVLWLVAFLLKRKLLVRPNYFIGFLTQGCVSCVIPYTFIALGQRSVDSGVAAILNSTTPLFVYLINMTWTHEEQIALSRLSGALVGLGGVVLVVGASALLGLRVELGGQVAILVATVSSAISAVHGRRFTDVAPEVAAASTLTCAALVLVPLSFLLDEPWHIVPSSRSLVALVANAVLATALGFVLYFRLIRTLGSMSTSSTSYLKPVVSVLIGGALLNEPFTLTLGIGLVAVLLGIAAINGLSVFLLLSGAVEYCTEVLFRKKAKSRN
jgi:drug/metabolite transporter (DMT)-like permease